MDLDHYLAHVADDGRVQTVIDHLNGTSELCSAFAERFDSGSQGRLIGLAHDIGKCSEGFQNRLKGGAIVDHAAAGAFECAKLDALWASGCVAGHHGGLPDFGNMRNDGSDVPTLYGRLKKAIGGNIPPYEVPVDLPDASMPANFGKGCLSDSYIIRMLYSCLVDADYLDTERFMSGTERETVCDGLPILLERLNKHIAPWWSPSNELNRMRCNILRTCIEKGKNGRKGVYTLTVPTGGGKTISSMAFALNHCVKNGMDRIIYVIPYTSIIEQTADVFRSIFGENNVLEHHSNASYEVSENGETSQYNSIQATENWDAPIIVTTAVQFFESIYSDRPSKCRKLHNIANSVVIFDEAQMLPSEHLRPCVAAISGLVDLFKCTAVLCTATQPFLNDLFTCYAFQPNIEEICDDTNGLYEAFRRVSFENAGELTIDALVDILSCSDQVLCIVNSRKGAQDLFNRLPDEGSFHLSTLMYPQHRREVIAEIRRRLKAGSTCRVVSTSLIEAGVDIDFPLVLREMAGIDSIFQAAGRCNREGKRPMEESKVIIFEGLSKVPELLKVNIGAAKEVLSSVRDPGSPEAVERYFKSYRSLAGGRLDKYGVIDAFTNGVQGRSFPFRTVSERFRFIADDSKTVYVPIGAGEKLVEALRNGERSRTFS